MGADPTLVAGAFKVAQSLVPQDLSGFYKTQYELRAKTMNDVMSFFKTRDEAAKEAMSVLTDKHDIIQSSLASSGRVQAPGEYDAISAQLDDVQERYKQAIKDKDKKTQHLLEGEASRIIQQIERLESGWGTVATFLKEGEIDAEATGEQTFAVINQVWDKDGDPSKITHSWEDGSLTYIVDTGNTEWGENGIVTIKADDLMGKVIPKAHAASGALLDFERKYREHGKKGGTYYSEDVHEEIKSSVFKTMKDFAGMVNWKTKGRLSFKESLMTSTEIWDALNDLDPTEIAKLEALGGVEDGVINAKDFKNGKNAATLISALTNIDDPNFNKEAAYNAGAAHLEKGVRGRYEEGNKLYKPPSDGSGYENKKVEWRYEEDGETKKGEIWSDDIINIQNELMALGKSNINSFKTDQTVLIAGQHYGYFKDRGFARVGKSTTGQVQLTLIGSKGKGALGPDDTPRGGWFKSIAEVLRDAGIPTTYLQYTQTASTGNQKLTW